jgi:ribosomal protein L30E
MGITDIIILALLLLLVGILFILIAKNTKLEEENKKILEILKLKDMTISNYEASRISVSEVIENFSSVDDVMVLLESGESREAISKKLNIPLAKIELIIKFDQLKKKQ